MTNAAERAAGWKCAPTSREAGHWLCRRPDVAWFRLLERDFPGVGQEICRGARPPVLFGQVPTTGEKCGLTVDS